MTLLRSICLAMLLLTAPVLAQEPRTGGDDMPPVEIDRVLGDLEPVHIEEGTRKGECLVLEQDEARQSCWRWTIAYYAYLERQLAHRSSVFWWQHLFSRIIFFVVMLIAGIGIYFAWRQFSPALALESTLELGTSGVKVTSPVLGVIILTLSLGFLYLYLAHVYPVVEVF